MADGLLTLFPCVHHPCLHHPRDCSLICMNSDAPVYHLGIYREKVSLQPVECQSVIDSGSLH